MKYFASTSVQAWAGGAALLALAGAGAYGYHDLGARYHALEQERLAMEAKMDAKAVSLSDQLYAAEQGIAAVQERLGGFENKVGDISGTVDVLEKLRNTDRELLQKYSKVFFLNEHYAPARLSQVDEEYDFKDGRIEKIHADVWPHLEDLLDDAKDDGVELFVKSAYRSFSEQKALKSAYTVTYGAGSANAFSADQGYSEHQLGTTLDFTASGQNGALTTGFEGTKAYPWLLKNAHEYGFVISYPKGNAYYMYEPWHWRYVGIKLATYLNEHEEYFYDLEQREIDEYLPDLFD